MQAMRLKARALSPLDAESSINAVQWCRARLSKEHPAALVDVHRFEADSKFFRSFVVVLFGLAIYFAAIHRDLPRLGWSLPFLIPALWRYIDQRFKATQQAYWSTIVL